MVSGKQHVRLDNIKKAREIWRLKAEGADLKTMTNQLSIPGEAIKDILKYTDSQYYTAIIKKPSYYDEQLLIKKKIAIKRERLMEAIDSLTSKKKIFSIILQATAVIIVALIVI